MDFCYRKEKIPRYKNEKRILRNSNVYNNPLTEGIDMENCDYFQETLENIFKEVDGIKGGLQCFPIFQNFSNNTQFLLYNNF